MQRRKIVIATLSVLLIGLTLTSSSVPRAHAFLASTPTVTLSGLTVSGFTDPLTGTTVDALAQGGSLTVNVYLVASSGSGAVYQRNVTIGFKGDWMASYTNASNASPTNTLAMNAGQTATVTISIPMPTSGGVAAHTWNVAIWDGASNSLNAASCFSFNNPEKSPACWTISNGSAGYAALAVYTADQLNAAQSNLQEESITANVQTELAAISGPLHTNPPGSTAAAGQLAQAMTEDSLGDQAWTNGDYSGAKNHYNNALNDANAAAAALTGSGGGTDSANLVNLILGGTGIALVGIGALFAGLGAFFYLRKKPKA
ncbi:MAG TPA: hypothetical protein VGS11_00850 [Candidatus Bathyarchaeia archaeon]|nr:hypothetical protein [Candidatus Bathyarchaeia archaeon]